MLSDSRASNAIGLSSWHTEKRLFDVSSSACLGRAIFPAHFRAGCNFVSGRHPRGATGTSVDNQSGIRNPDGTFYQVGQPLANIASQNQSNPNAMPLCGQWTDPRLQMPYTRQASFGWSHELMPSTV